MFRSGIIVMMITMLSRVLGLFRTVIIAYYFGASKFTDAYFSAFKISNFFRQVLGEGALGTVFIPVYNEKVVEEGEERAKTLIYSVINLLFVVTTVLSILTVVFSSKIIGFIVNGYPSETQMIASKLLKIMGFYLLFIGLSGMICAILNNFKRFVIPASTSLLFNISVICSAIFFNKTLGVEGLAYGVLFGGILQFLVVVPSFLKILKEYKFKVDIKDVHLKKIFLLIIPMLLGIFAKQINSIVDQYFASHLATGGVTALENATRLYNLPLGVFGISISTVIYPTMSKAIAEKKDGVLEDNLIKGLNILLFLILPSIAVFTFYSKDVIELIFSRGRYSEEAIRVTAQSLFFYSVGLYFYTAIHLISRAYYSMKNTKDPVRFSITSIVINVILNSLLIGRYRHIGLALATSISACVNFTLLLYFFRKKYLSLHISSIVKFGIKMSFSIVPAILLSYNIRNIILKLIVFSVVYLGIWIIPLYKRKINFFRGVGV